MLLAKVLLENPMILILDEPTNFLDENHINWLSEFLQNYENAFILVSHDMPFLTKVTNVIYHLENTVLTRYKGTYEDFLRMYDLKKQQVEQAYKKQQKKIADLEEFVARNKARAATATLARSRQKELDKIERIELAPEKVKPTFNFQTDRAPGRVVISAEDLVIGYDTPLTRKIKIEIERNKKIAIRGVNGLGKSTLLKTLLKIIPPIEGKVHHDQFINVGYFEQEESASNKTAMQEFWDEFPSMTNAEARAALAKCGLTTEHITTHMKVLSGGENAKVRLCKIMQRPANILVLDEPTNHLDILAKEELAKAIREFRGTVLLVCHEAEFYENVVDEVWDVSDWSTKIV